MQGLELAFRHAAPSTASPARLDILSAGEVKRLLLCKQIACALAMPFFLLIPANQTAGFAVYVYG